MISRRMISRRNIFRWVTGRGLICGLLALALTSFCMAQARGGGFGQGTPGFGRGVGFAGHHNRGLGRGSFYFGDPFFYADYPSGSLAPETFSPPVVVVREESARATATEERTEPLLIEWQGDRYVRWSGTPSAVRAEGSPDYSEAASRAPRAAAHSASVSGNAELPPAVLIFRDGHQENVSNYVITRGVLYTRDNYPQAGASTRNIQLAALDLQATLRANQENGLRFVLPNSLNDVVTRP